MIKFFMSTMHNHLLHFRNNFFSLTQKILFNAYRINLEKKNAVLLLTDLQYSLPMPSVAPVTTTSRNEREMFDEIGENY